MHKKRQKLRVKAENEDKQNWPTLKPLQVLSIRTYIVMNKEQ